MLDYYSIGTPSKLGLKLIKNSKGKKINNAFYKQIVRSLMYLTTIKSDIMFVLSLISMFMECPTYLHPLAIKKILRYIKGTLNFGILYQKGNLLALVIVFMQGT